MANKIERTLRWLKSLRRMSSILLVLAGIIVNGYSQVRKDIEISSYLYPDLPSAAFFTNDVKHSGGVSPLGTAHFYSPAGDKLTPADLRLRVIHPEKFGNGVVDFDAVGLEWNSAVYTMATIDNMLLPAMEFVKSGSTIAYTIPLIRPDSSYLSKNRLVDDDGWLSYVFDAFTGKNQIDFLYTVDVSTQVESLPMETQTRIVTSFGQPALRNFNGHLRYSYVNTDIIVAYQVYLETEGGKRVVNVGGNPLRYYYQDYDGNSNVSVFRVSKFTFPESAFDSQDQAFIFFQMTAIMRKFYHDNPVEFNRFYDELQRLMN